MNQRLNGLLDTVCTVLVIVTATAVLWQILRPNQASGPAQVEAIEPMVVDGTELRNRRGSGEIVLLEFADFECPFCARHVQTTESVIEAAFIDKGNVEHAFAHFPLPNHPNAKPAAQAAECAADQGEFWTMRESLFSAAGKLSEDDLRERADRLALKDPTRFEACLKDAEVGTRVETDANLGRKLGVAATPSFLVGTKAADGSVTFHTKINGAIPTEKFREIISKVVEENRKLATNSPGYPSGERVAAELVR